MILSNMVTLLLSATILAMKLRTMSRLYTANRLTLAPASDVAQAAPEH